MRQTGRGPRQQCRRARPDADAYPARRVAAGDSRPEALRALKRRISDVVYRALLTDATRVATPSAQNSAKRLDTGARGGAILSAGAHTPLLIGRGVVHVC